MNEENDPTWETGERIEEWTFLWPLASFPGRHTYSIHSAQYSLSSCFEQFCWDLIRTCGFATCCLTDGTSNLWTKWWRLLLPIFFFNSFPFFIMIQVFRIPFPPVCDLFSFSQIFASRWLDINVFTGRLCQVVWVEIKTSNLVNRLSVVSAGTGMANNPWKGRGWVTWTVYILVDTNHISGTVDRIRCCQLKWTVTVVNWWWSRSPVYHTDRRHHSVYITVGARHCVARICQRRLRLVASMKCLGEIQIFNRIRDNKSIANE